MHHRPYICLVIRTATSQPVHLKVQMHHRPYICLVIRTTTSQPVHLKVQILPKSHGSQVAHISVALALSQTQARPPDRGLVHCMVCQNTHRGLVHCMVCQNTHRGLVHCTVCQNTHRGLVHCMVCQNTHRGLVHCILTSFLCFSLRLYTDRQTLTLS